jgi:hypothetical protein
MYVRAIESAEDQEPIVSGEHTSAASAWIGTAEGFRSNGGVCRGDGLIDKHGQFHGGILARQHTAEPVSSEEHRRHIASILSMLGAYCEVRLRSRTLACAKHSRGGR